MASPKKKPAKKASKSSKPTAKKAPASKAVAPEQSSASQQAVRVLLSKKDLLYLANTADDSMNKAGRITSELGQEISTYAKKGLDAQAFRMVLRLKRMGQRDPIKLRSVLDNRTYYEEVLGIENMASTMLPGLEHPATKARSRKKKDDEDSQGEIQLPPADNVTHIDDHRQDDTGDDDDPNLPENEYDEATVA